MAHLLLVGGVRSGKSRLAVQMASRSGGEVVVIATAEARDEEMEQRIARHRAERPADWTTLEEPLDLAGALGSAPEGSFVVVDCLTLWVSNLIHKGLSDDEVVDRAREATRMAADHGGSVVVVTNEVGSGVIPDSDLGRRYCNVLGAVNAAWAEAADRTALVVAGKVLPLQGAEALSDG